MKLLASLVRTGSVESFLKFPMLDGMFLGEELPVFHAMLEHMSKFGAVPSRSAIEEKVGTLAWPDTPDDPEYYYDGCRQRWVHRELAKTMGEAAKILNDPAQDPEVARMLMGDRSIELYIQTNPTLLVDFRQALGPLIEHYKKVYKQKMTHSGINYGWDHLDSLSSGLWPGDFVAYVGRPAMGKTFFLLNTGLHTWGHQQTEVLMVTTEMIPLLMLQRASAMWTHKNMTHVKDAMLGQTALNDYKLQLASLKDYPVPFWIVDGRVAQTVNDIYLLARKLKPKLILIDGAYRLRHPNSRLGRFERAAENADLIKDKLATELDTPVIASYQLNRDAAKKAKKSGDGEQTVDLEDIGYTDAIGQLASVVLGLFQHESVETLKSRRIDILKGRYGETGHFVVNWDFHNMNFDEIDMSKVGDLEYVG